MKESIYLDIFAQMGATEPYFLCGLMGKLRDFSDSKSPIEHFPCDVFESIHSLRLPETEKHPMRSKGASAGWIRLQLEKISAPVDAVSGTREKQTFESAGLGSMVFCAWRHKQLKCQITLQELCTMVDENSRLNHATVLQLICRKDSHGLKHEFLLAEIELATSKHIWMRMERSAGERLAGTGGWASLSSEFSAHDPVTASATCDVLLEGSAPSKIMAEIQFTRKKPSLALLRQLLLSLLEKSPFYHLTTDNCWFFCTVILRILGERFDDSVRREKAPGWFRTLVGKGFEESLQKISKLFEERLRSGMAERRLPGLEQREGMLLPLVFDIHSHPVANDPLMSRDLDVESHFNRAPRSNAGN
jgi:hypothetical protein